jgi:hypothetical protein
LKEKTFVHIVLGHWKGWIHWFIWGQGGRHGRPHGVCIVVHGNDLWPFSHVWQPLV